MKVPFVDMARLHEETRDEMLAAFARVLDSGAFVQGHEVVTFEEEFRTSYGVAHALAVSNGTAALHLALLACGVGPGDEVITVSNTFIATVEAISMAGATPVFADIDPETMNIDPREALRQITPRTKAVIAVHLYGRVAPMAELRAICDQRGLALIEDACQAHGAELDGRRAGTIGDIGCLSFYPTKNLGTVGEGGMVLTNDAARAARMSSLRNHGQTDRHVHTEPGFNYRMPELQAAALRVLLPHLAEWNQSRIRAARRYATLLGLADVRTPALSADGGHVYHLYVIQSDERTRLQRFLQERGVASAVHYPTPIHLQPAYRSDRFPIGSLPHTERAVAEILSLPMHPHITDAEVAAVCDAIAEFEHAMVTASAAAGGF